MLKSAVFFMLLAVGALANYKLIFDDNFNELNVNAWEHELTLGGGGNWEFQMYTNNRSTSFVENGVLYLRPILTSDTIGEANVRGGYRYDAWGSSPANLCTGNAFYGCERTSGAGGNYLNPIKSARLRTVNSFNIKYGKVEVRAKMPKGDWLWPAIWMLPKSNYYGEWPSSGEIDIVESRGNAPHPNYEGVDTVLSTLHWGPHWPQNGYPLTSKAYKKTNGKTFNDEFHTYTLEWSPSRIVTHCDGQIILDVDTSRTSFWERGGWNSTSYDNPWKNRPTNAPFDQPFYIILNLAVGGTGGFFVDGYPGKPWSNTSPNAVNQFYDAKGQWLPTWDMNNKAHPSALQIDYVRVYCDTSIAGSC